MTKAPSKLEQVAGLRLSRYLEKGPGAKRAKPVLRPSIEKLRDDVAKVAKKKKKAKRGRR